MRPDDEIIDFLADEAPVATAPPDDGLRWKLLIVDDDEEVHTATRFALQQQHLCGRPLQLMQARSAAEAALLIAGEADIAVILLDVVMESPDAGLQLIQRIRQELGRSEVRIVLRTGQPGHAPELEVIRDYDINDYKTKAELTHTRLITTLIAAIRSYEQLRAINDNRRGLQLIVGAASGLVQAETLAAFGQEVLHQLVALLHLPGDGLVCACPGTAESPVRMVAASGDLARYAGQALDQLAEPAIATILKECSNGQRHFFGPRHIALHLHDHQYEATVYVRNDHALTAVDHQLAEVFAANVASCFGNLKLLQRLHFAAYHDPLTRLPNRTRFLADLDHAGALARPGQTVCLLDIAHFTDINNRLGPAIGDQLLVAVARRLVYACRDCRVARIGGDRFGLLGNETVLAPAHLQAILAEAFLVGEHQLQLDADLGYCPISERTDGNTLFRRADMALSRARLSHDTNHIVFTLDMEEQTRWRLDLIHRLRQDFIAGRLAVWYQPQFSLADNQVTGLEALARWPLDDGFVHPPEVFIRLAEDAGLIIDLGAWVLDQSCATYRRLQQAGQAPHRMAVNVSMAQFHQPDFPDRVLDILATHDMPATALELEITESLLLDEPQIVLTNLQALRRAGVQIAVDDFGTGYSSLAYLRQLPIDCLKIDRSFVCEIDNGRGDLFAETIVDIAHKLGIATIAEGVETTAQVDRLRQLGCDTAQGFLYARPMPADELARWFAGRRGH